MWNKSYLTERILELVREQTDISVDQARREWWVNFRAGGGMRLTDRGYEIFSQVLDLEQWQFEIAEQVVVPRNLILLDKKMTCPYYLRRHRRDHWLHMFGDREAMVATLYGDVERFLQNLSTQQS